MGERVDTVIVRPFGQPDAWIVLVANDVETLDRSGGLRQPPALRSSSYRQRLPISEVHVPRDLGVLA